MVDVCIRRAAPEEDFDADDETALVVVRVADEAREEEDWKVEGLSDSGWTEATFECVEVVWLDEEWEWEVEL